MSKKLTAVGITCGIGSMLVGARQARFKVLGNIEWRRYYHRPDEEGKSTFLSNFRGAFMKEKIEGLTKEELRRVTGVDLAMGHPECGAYSQMQGCNNFRGQAHSAETKAKSPMDIPIFTRLVNELRPRFFVMDDLPKSLVAYPMAAYTAQLPDYDLFPEWVSNYHYGNIQKNRRRMFMIGALKSERFVFQPGEEDHGVVLRDIIGDLPVNPVPGDFPNHDLHTEVGLSGRGLHMNYLWHRPTWGEMREWYAARPEGVVFEYHSTSGGIKKKPGWYKQRWEGTCAVLDGGSGHMHPLRNLPFTIRERARIQGFPDSFIFYGTRFDENREWMLEKNIDMLKQTGKAMPIQFCRYIANQVRAHINQGQFQSSGKRLIKSNPYIDEAKRWYCSEIGYTHQARVCKACWLWTTCQGNPTVRGVTEEISPTVIPDRRTPKKQAVVKKAQERKIKRPGLILSPRPIRIFKVRAEKGGESPRVPVVRIRLKKIPKDYHCCCKFCQKALGELRPKDGTYYSRLERRKYYDKSESGGSGHVAKTPLHIARWAIQQYTEPGDWVFDPTAGAGTTLVEALRQGRNTMGIELQFKKILLANIRKQKIAGYEAIIGIGDARKSAKFLSRVKRQPTLIINNPPYSGDEHWSTFNVPAGKRSVGQWSTQFKGYDRRLANLAFLKEGAEYWQLIANIYQQCIKSLLPGGRFVIGVKDQMRQKKPDQLHEKFALVLENLGLVHEGTAFLKHYPGTLHLHTYFKRYGVHPPYYQTILVFRKER